MVVSLWCCSVLNILKHDAVTQRFCPSTLLAQGKKNKGRGDDGRPKRPGFFASWLAIAAGVIGLFGFGYYTTEKEARQIKVCLLPCPSFLT